MIPDNTPVFYVPGRIGVVDLAILGADGIHRSKIRGETLDQVRARYPGAQLGELGPVARAAEESFRRPPVEIDRERFDYLLGVLPPVGWTGCGYTESFKLGELTYGAITAIACKHGERYFELQDRITMTHGEILLAVMQAFPELRP